MKPIAIFVASLVLAGCSENKSGVDSGASNSEAGSCSIIGTWKGAVPSGPFAGQTNTWQIKSDGTTLGTIAATTIAGTWKLNGAVLTLTDTSSTPASIACPAGQEGTYSATFSADCSKLTLHATNEPCDGRKVAVDNFAPTRQ